MTGAWKAEPEEARIVLEVVKPYCEGILEEYVSPRFQSSSRLATIKNNKGELLRLHISWLPRYGPQEMMLHLSRVLEECQPRMAIMTGICAGDARQTHLGDLVVAERTFTYDNGKFTLDEHPPNRPVRSQPLRLLSTCGHFGAQWCPRT